MAAKPWNVVPLVLTVNDKQYSIAPLGWDDGLTLIATVGDEAERDGRKALPKDSPDEVMYRHCMGAVWDEMLADGCPHPVLTRAAWAAVQYQTALVVFGLDCETAVEHAEKVWAEGLDPEAVAAVLAAKRTSPKATSTPSTSSAAARKTPRPASTSGTRSRTATPRSASKAPSGSTGRRSSGSGRSS
jgi:hypothetical protein